MSGPRQLLLLAALAALACPRPPEPEPTTLSPNARPEILEMLRGDLAAQRHPADGGGKVWIEEGPASAPAGSYQRWRLIYEAGPLGIAEGGMVFLQAPPFWGWSTPQTTIPEFEGYTTVSTEAEGVELEPETVGHQLLAVRIGGRALAAGERIELAYGGAAGARVDTYAERASRFWLAVDGDGDGIRELVADPPAVEIVAGPPARLVVTTPSVASPGEEIAVTVAVLDPAGNAGVSFAGEIEVTAPSGLELPARVELEPAHRGRTTFTARALAEGLYRVEAAAPGGLAARSNPLKVATGAEPVLWADLHGHSGLSDGTGTPADYLAYAREVAALDVIALTDHDHWGLRPLARHGELWERIRREIEAAHRPGELVTLLGYEWTSWLHGHRHVLFFGPGGEVLSSVDPAFEDPVRLWQALEGRPALTLAHHTAGAPIAANWDFAPHSELEPVTEISSVHGSSEAADSPRVVAGAIDGNFARDALDRGYRLGFVGSGDSHDGHPGLAHLASPNGGLAALVGAERTRESVLATLRARRVYATNGPRILLAATLNGHPMGAVIEAPGRAELTMRAAGTAPIERVDLVRSGQVAASEPGGGEEIDLVFPLSGLGAGEYVYLRVVQEDGGAAWSSPFFFE